MGEFRRRKGPHQLQGGVRCRRRNGVWRTWLLVGEAGGPGFESSHTVSVVWSGGVGEGLGVDGRGGPEPRGETLWEGRGWGY